MEATEGISLPIYRENCEPLWWPSELGQRLVEAHAMEDDRSSISALRDVNGLAASIALKEDFSGTVEQTVRLFPI